MIYVLAIVAFVYVLHHVAMIVRVASHDDMQRNIHLHNVTHYDYVNATYNRHDRLIVRDTLRHVI